MRIRSGKVAESPDLDAVDTGIIDLLRGNGRASNQEIADRLSITAATVSTRLKRLEETKVMRVVAVTDFSAFGYDILVAIGVSVRGRPVADVARDLAKLSEVFSVNVMHGKYDIELLVALHDFSELNLFLTEHISGIRGLTALTPGIAANILKFEFGVAPL